MSQATRRLAEDKGLAPGRLCVIPNGLDVAAFAGAADRAALAARLGRALDHTTVLLTTGRLVRRKGAAWFIREVMPQLPDNVIYVLAGAGPDEADIRAAVAARGLADRVLLLGRVDDRTRDLLLHSADIFIQPNIPVAGDMEGFGIAVLEAGICARPVLASALEGLLDAVADGRNGQLLPVQDAPAWQRAIIALQDDPAAAAALGARAAAHVRTHHHWAAIAARYAAFMVLPQSGSKPSN